MESGARESEEDLAKLVADLQKRMEQTEVWNLILLFVLNKLLQQKSQKDSKNQNFLFYLFRKIRLRSTGALYTL